MHQLNMPDIDPDYIIFSFLANNGGISNKDKSINGTCHVGEGPA